jgi:hypothetical protein
MLTQGHGKALFTCLSRYSGIPGKQRKRLHAFLRSKAVALWGARARKA